MVDHDISSATKLPASAKTVSAAVELVEDYGERPMLLNFLHLQYSGK
jgi:hypothetical protein